MHPAAIVAQAESIGGARYLRVPVAQNDLVLPCSIVLSGNGERHAASEQCRQRGRSVKLALAGRDGSHSHWVLRWQDAAMVVATPWRTRACIRIHRPPSGDSNAARGAPWNSGARAGHAARLSFRLEQDAGRG
ncbi:hypothetical protein [Lysobacter sp.]|uniref:hypothetical protein n=1 Tax=Lysobacter sp. TaxID=72226 RepID=UPI002D311BF8|nr:hypothetical protein [Lysobacter sp.]HZX76396.1 hypothetical protein [Lysobacter sp.]